MGTASTEMDEIFRPERPEFHMLCLANHVELVNGLLYISGASWTEHRRVAKRADSQPTLSRLAIAAIVSIPWNETNKAQHFKIEVQTLDGETSLAKLEGVLNAGRPSQLLPGGVQYAPVAIAMEVVFANAGMYVVRGSLNDDPRSLKTWEFRVFDLAPPGV